MSSIMVRVSGSGGPQVRAYVPSGISFNIATSVMRGPISLEPSEKTVTSFRTSDLVTDAGAAVEGAGIGVVSATLGRSLPQPSSGADTIETNTTAHHRASLFIIQGALFRTRRPPGEFKVTIQKSSSDPFE
jgi:hypothetical protein